MMLIALIIKVSSRGPIFYRQVRSSLGGQPFKIIKFRTMKENSEATTGAIWATPNDSRVTRVGRFLRRTSLDELPQLFNVLVGHMSLVGPRPERPELIERFRHQVPRYMLRHQVKAGLAGWAQVHGLRGQTSLRKRVQYDLYYVTNWSFGLDLRVLLMVPFKGFVNRNAH
jgi:lipopolysaccharide/colanic/teichoic acid biosynthesis glycosyltransferase